MPQTHPLDATFNMPSDQLMSDILGTNIKIPDDPTLRTIVEFALDQYKSLVEESMLLEPDQRLRHMEMAKEYLKIAKDAMREDADLSIKHMRATQGQPKGAKQIPDGGEGGKERGDIYKRIQEEKKNK